MKKILILLGLLALSFNGMAQDVDDLFGGGEEEFKFERFSNGNILMEIDRDAQLACRGGLCTLTSMTSHSKGWSVTMSVGKGNSMNNGSGTTINLGDSGHDNGYNSGDDEYYGLSVKYVNGSCTQNINVPRSLYYSLNRYLYGLMNEDGSPRRGFTPADETMILFYLTISSKASGCSFSGNGNM